MKKIIALVLAIMMIASMSVVVFAEDATERETIKYGDENGEYATDASINKDIDVTYNVQKGYVVVIPAAFDLVPEDVAVGSDTLTKGTDSAEVKILKAKLEGGETLTVSAVSANKPATHSVSTKWVLLDQKATNKANPVGYTITLGTSTVLDQGDPIVQHVSGTPFPTAGKTVTMNLETNPTSQAGNFKDVLTFTVAITTATQG